MVFNFRKMNAWFYAETFPDEIDRAVQVNNKTNEN
jgi:hypothetical protein